MDFKTFNTNTNKPKLPPKPYKFLLNKFNKASDINDEIKTDFNNKNYQNSLYNIMKNFDKINYKNYNDYINFIALSILNNYNKN